MSLETFHEDSKRVFRCERVPTSPFGHAFGGSADYLGLTAFAGNPPVHLLFRLDMNDPAVGVTLPGIRWLPLLCAIRYGACDLGYRVKSDAEVEILHQGERKAWAGFPYKRFPEKLPTEPVAFREVAFDPGNRKNALSFAGFFGCDALSPDQLEAVTGIVERADLHEIFGFESPEEYLREGNDLPFVQSRPEDVCPNPSCSKHARPGELRTFGIFEEEEPNKVRKLWGPDCGSLQIIYQICPKCATIRTTNQCD